MTIAEGAGGRGVVEGMPNDSLHQLKRLHQEQTQLVNQAFMDPPNADQYLRQLRTSLQQTDQVLRAIPLTK